MYYYSTASTSNAAYFIGGSGTQDVIAEFKNAAWRQLGTLTKGRQGHASISMGDETMVIGATNLVVTLSAGEFIVMIYFRLLCLFQ